MWLIADRTALEMRERLSSGIHVSSDLEALFSDLVIEASTDGKPRNLSISGRIASIGVDGLLTAKPDLFALWFGYGNTTYGAIQQAVAMAEADPNVDRIEFNINSPGGTVEGLFETLSMIDAARKPRTVRTSFAASAAYAIAAVAGPITATNPAAEVGSVGVAVRFFVSDRVVDIASTEAPKKRPDVTTDEGKAMVREELDALHAIFVDAIAHGRDTTADKVNTNFGRGGLLVAVEAKQRGMIDQIEGRALKPVPNSSSDATAADAAGERVAEATAAPDPKAAPAASVAAPTLRNKPMTKDELKAQHSDVYEAVREEGRKEGHAAGLKEGEANERDRVTGHLELGEQCGAMDIATAAIKDGSVMSQTLTAKYLGRGMNRKEQAERTQELQSANAAMDGAAKPKDEAPSLMTAVTDILCKQAGIAG